MSLTVPLSAVPELVVKTILEAKRREDVRSVMSSEEMQFARQALLDSGSPYQRAQLLQDSFALWANENKSDGFFVEVGASDGTSLSNTLLLEKIGWTGILSEPEPSSYNSLVLANTGSQTITDPRAVWSKSGDVIMIGRCPERGLSSVVGCHERDHYIRTFECMHAVETVSLDDLLREHDAPKTIDFLSVDTEGCETEILQSFPFDRWDVRAIAVEWNYVDERLQQLDDIILPHGFKRVFQRFSMWDAWYVPEGSSHES